MATTVARLEAVLSANTRDFDRGMQRSEGRMHRAGKAAGVMGGILAGGLAVGLASSVKEAIQAEKANTRLAQAYSRGVKGGIDPYRKSIEKAGKAAVNLGFDDEDLKDSLGSLIIATHSNRKAQNLANIAMDVARFKNVDLQAATKMLTMAMAGSQRATKQLGISVSAVTDEQAKAKNAFDATKDAIDAHYKSLGTLTPAEEKAKQAALDHAKAMYEGAKAAAQVADKQATTKKVIDATRDAVKGQADAYSQTAEGQMKVFQEKTDNLKEHLGTVLLPALGKVVDKLIKMADWLERNPKVMKGLIIALGALTVALLAAAAAQAALNLAVLANPYVAATVALIAFYGAVFILYEKFKQLRPYLEFFVETIAGLPLPLRLALLALGGVHGAVEKLHKPIMLLADAFHTLYNWASKVKDVLDWMVKHAKGIGGFFSDLAGKIPGRGDVFDPDMLKPPTGTAGDLHGAKEVMRPFANMGAGYGLHITAGRTDHAKYTKSGKVSDHWYGKALDMADGPTNMAWFFRALIGNPKVKQAFYDPLGSIFGGALSSYREGGHSDHVHVATYDQGGYLRPGWNLAYNGLGRPEPVGAGAVTFNFPNYVGSKSELMGWLQNAAQQFRRANGRGPF